MPQSSNTIAFTNSLALFRPQGTPGVDTEDSALFNGVRHGIQNQPKVKGRNVKQFAPPPEMRRPPTGAQGRTLHCRRGKRGLWPPCIGLVLDRLTRCKDESQMMASNKFGFSFSVPRPPPKLPADAGTYHVVQNAGVPLASLASKCMHACAYSLRPCRKQRSPLSRFLDFRPCFTEEEGRDRTLVGRLSSTPVSTKKKESGARLGLCRTRCARLRPAVAPSLSRPLTVVGRRCGEFPIRPSGCRQSGGANRRLSFLVAS